jgi:capsule polysaccharide export protein KpsE/RkpR
LKCAFLAAALCVLVPFSLWAAGCGFLAKLSRRIQNEADLLDSFSSELKLNAAHVKRLQELLTKADISLSEWKTLSEERQREYLALLADYESMRKKLRNSRRFWIGIAAASFAAGAAAGIVTGLAIN